MVEILNGDPGLTKSTYYISLKIHVSRKIADKPKFKRVKPQTKVSFIYFLYGFLKLAYSLKVRQIKSKNSILRFPIGLRKKLSNLPWAIALLLNKISFVIDWFKNCESNRYLVMTPKWICEKCLNV